MKTKLLPHRLGLPSVTAMIHRQAAKPYRLLKGIPVGGESCWDYLTEGSAVRRLRVSRATMVMGSRRHRLHEPLPPKLSRH